MSVKYASIVVVILIVVGAVGYFGYRFASKLITWRHLDLTGKGHNLKSTGVPLRLKKLIAEQMNLPLEQMPNKSKRKLPDTTLSNQSLTHG